MTVEYGRPSPPQQLGREGSARGQGDVENDLDREVRSKIKNLEEGTSDFEIEYTRVMEQIKQKRRLS